MTDFTLSSDLPSDLREELRSATAEPLLPFERKLVAGSLGIGLTLLVVLAALNHFFPAG